MLDLRPVGYVIGLLVAALGVTMLAPLLADLVGGTGAPLAFLESGLLTIAIGGMIAMACRNGLSDRLTVRDAFLLASGTWFVLPLFGTLPFILGETELSLTDAFFESMSGMTTTGSTVISGLDDRGYGILLWRAILQWLGGVGIVVVAMIFLPVMRVGGMQFFQSEGFDTLGKALPRAIDISVGLINVYLVLTIAAVIAYVVLGMSIFDAVAHALTTVSTGGFSTTDKSIGGFPPAVQYASVIFMILASIPFIRMFQLAIGQPGPILRDPQIRTYLIWLAYATALVVIYRALREDTPFEEVLRFSLVNIVSFFSGTGYGTGDVTTWGPFAFMVLFMVGAIGGCTGSTGCSIKVFRYQILLRSLLVSIRKVHSPNRVARISYGGQPVETNVLDSVILMFTVFMVTFFLLIVGLSMTGLSFLSSVTAAWTAIFNVGPAFGSIITDSGSLERLPEAAKWQMIFGMYLGRLEIVSVIVVLLPRFWRA
ncbi:MAG: TrkH family potassium uptake protein [Salibaculum sp.]|jgi:trk system potassium uptake protein TrkH|uniref:TrkH family potassium uptake protein n=1 Tax=Roseovarius halophilus (ex Wu et al. 2025) TaxID=3376060 RepID=UPI002870A137|nr:TrkH family potassium uptake protein [Salibaculum sp.]MDR9426537.1 TrkH family potassium uptake protein [Salibaculum sp.]MDR9481198.1 TrkH family potassium uptake protein [Salibaculum sp.]